MIWAAILIAVALLWVGLDWIDDDCHFDDD